MSHGDFPFVFWGAFAGGFLGVICVGLLVRLGLWGARHDDDDEPESKA